MNSLFQFLRTHSIFLAVIFSILLLLIFYNNLPVSNQGEFSLANWADQGYFLDNLNETLSGKLAGGLKDNRIGNGYLALAVLIKKGLDISPEAALVKLNRVVFSGTVIIVFIFCLSLLNTILKGFPLRVFIVLNAFLYTLLILLSSNLNFISDLPWPHFCSTFFLLLCVLSFFLTLKSISLGNRFQYIYLTFFSISFSFLINIRSMGAMALILSLIIWAIYELVLKFRSIRSSLNVKKHLLVGAKFFSIFLLSSLAIHLLCAFITNNPRINIMYLSRIFYDETSAVGMSVFYLDFPIKFIQLFLEPNFFSYDQYYSIVPLLFGSSLKSPWMPLIFQAPVLIFSLPFTLLPFFTLIFRKSISAHLSAGYFLPLLISMMLILGYTCNATAGSPHLKYGYIRNYMVPIWLLCICSGPFLIFFIKKAFCNKDSSQGIFIALFTPSIMVCILSILIGQIIPLKIQASESQSNLINFNKYHITDADIRLSCSSDGSCDISIDLLNPFGDIIRPITSNHLISASCKNNHEKIFILFKGHKYTFKAIRCHNDYEIKVYPLIMGYLLQSSIPGFLKKTVSIKK